MIGILIDSNKDRRVYRVRLQDGCIPTTIIVDDWRYTCDSPEPNAIGEIDYYSEESEVGVYRPRDQDIQMLT